MFWQVVDLSCAGIGIFAYIIQDQNLVEKYCYRGSGMNTEDLLKDKREAIIKIAAKHGAHNVRIFGSTARGDAHEQSDIDLLVDMEPNRSLMDMGLLRMDLQALLGRKVDVMTEAGLYWLLRRRILKEARSL